MSWVRSKNPERILKACPQLFNDGNWGGDPACLSLPKKKERPQKNQIDKTSVPRTSLNQADGAMLFNFDGADHVYLIIHVFFRYNGSTSWCLSIPFDLDPHGAAWKFINLPSIGVPPGVEGFLKWEGHVTTGFPQKKRPVAWMILPSHFNHFGYFCQITGNSYILYHHTHVFPRL